MNESRQDIDLLQAIAEGDRDALALLYDRYDRMVYGLAYRMVQDPQVAEEIVQDVFTRIWQKASFYDATQSKFTTWLLQITRNRTIDVLKHKKRKQQEIVQEDAVLISAPDQNPGTEDSVLLSLEQEEIKLALTMLNEDQKNVIQWMYFQGLTQQEITERYQIPLGTVKSRARLALGQLRQTLNHLRKGGSANGHIQSSV